MRGMIMTRPALDKAMTFVALFQAELRSGAGLGMSCARAGALAKSRAEAAASGASSEIRREEIRFTNNGHTSRATLSVAGLGSQLEHTEASLKKPKTDRME